MPTPHILVVDDEEQIRNLVALVLTEEGFKVSAAADTFVAERMMLQNHFDIVLTDIYMPGRDGLSMMKTMIHDLPSTKFIVMSGSAASTGYFEVAIELGAAGILEKPFGLASLTRVIHEVLEARPSTSVGFEKQVARAYCEAALGS